MQQSDSQQEKSISTTDLQEDTTQPIQPNAIAPNVLPEDIVVTQTEQQLKVSKIESEINEIKNKQESSQSNQQQRILDLEKESRKLLQKQRQLEAQQQLYSLASTTSNKSNDTTMTQST